VSSAAHERTRDAPPYQVLHLQLGAARLLGERGELLLGVVVVGLDLAGVAADVLQLALQRAALALGLGDVGDQLLDAALEHRDLVEQAAPLELALGHLLARGLRAVVALLERARHRVALGLHGLHARVELLYDALELDALEVLLAQEEQLARRRHGARVGARGVERRRTAGVRRSGGGARRQARQRARARRAGRRLLGQRHADRARRKARRAARRERE
jgi:hypothetical protein